MVRRVPDESTPTPTSESGMVRRVPDESTPTPTSESSSYGRNVGLSLAFTLLTTVVAFVNSIAIARLAGPDARGSYALVVSVCAVIGPVFGLGLPAAATWLLRRKEHEGDVAGLGLLAGAAVSALGILVCLGILRYGGAEPADPLLFAALGVAAALPALNWIELSRGVYLGQNRMVAYNAALLFSALGLLAFNLVFARFGPHSVVWNLVASSWLVAVGALLHLAWRGVPLRWPRREPSRIALSYGGSTLGASLAEAGVLRSDTVVMGGILPAASIGIYAVADQLAHVMSWGGLIAGRLLLAESAADPTGESSGRKLWLSVRVLVTGMGLAAVGTAATGWFLVPWVFGAAFEAAWWGTLLLIPAATARAVSSLLGNWLLGQAHGRAVFRIGVAATVAEVVLVGALAFPFGWPGAALGRVAACAAQAALTLRAYVRAAPPRDVSRWWMDREDAAALLRWGRARVARTSQRRAARYPERP
jgi:O-antigen/teichoic acid export membrane protein